MRRRFSWTLPFLGVSVLLLGCSGDSGLTGTSSDPWQVTSDRQNGDWEVTMLTSDEIVQEAFIKQHGFFYSELGDPVLWLRKVDMIEPYEPEVWAVDDKGHRIPFNYTRFSTDGSTYLVVSLVPAPSSARTLDKLQIELRGEIVAEWSIRSPNLQSPSTWPALDGEGSELTLVGVDLSIKPRRRHQTGGENSGSSFQHSDEVAEAGIDEEFEYELRYTVPDEFEPDFVSHYFNRAARPGRGQGGFGGGGGRGGGQDDYEELGTYDADVLFRMMKYQPEPFEFTWDADVAKYETRDALEAAQAPSADIDNGHFVVYGMYWSTDYYGPNSESAWLRVKGTGESRREFSNELQSGWTSVFFESCSAGRLMNQYVLDDGSTMLAFNGSGMVGGWQGGEFSISGTLRNIASYEEKVTRMTLPVTRAVVKPETEDEE